MLVHVYVYVYKKNLVSKFVLEGRNFYFLPNDFVTTEIVVGTKVFFYFFYIAHEIALYFSHQVRFILFICNCYKCHVLSLGHICVLHWPGTRFTNVSRALQNNLAKIHNARNHICVENSKLKLCTNVCPKHGFQLEILIRSTISAIHKFRLYIMESSRNVSETTPMCRYIIVVMTMVPGRLH